MSVFKLGLKSYLYLGLKTEAMGPKAPGYILATGLQSKKKQGGAKIMAEKDKRGLFLLSAVMVALMLVALQAALLVSWA